MKKLDEQIAQLQLRASNIRRVKVQANLVDDCNDNDDQEEGLDSESIELEVLALHESTEYLLDFDASSHVTGNRSTLSSYQPDYSHFGVFIASGTLLLVIGKVTLRVDSSKEIKPILYVPGLTKNILSIGLLSGSSFLVMFTFEYCFLFNNTNIQRSILFSQCDPCSQLY